MSEDPEEEKPQVKIPEELRTKVAMEMVIEHGIKQSEIITGMLSQAEVAIDRSMAAPHDGPGSVLKMILPIMLGRRKYLRAELEMWNVTLEMVKEDWKNLQEELERKADAEAKEEPWDEGHPPGYGVPGIDPEVPA